MSAYSYIYIHSDLHKPLHMFQNFSSNDIAVILVPFKKTAPVDRERKMFKFSYLKLVKPKPTDVFICRDHRHFIAFLRSFVIYEKHSSNPEKSKNNFVWKGSSLRDVFSKSAGWVPLWVSTISGQYH